MLRGSWRVQGLAGLEEQGSLSLLGLPWLCLSAGQITAQVMSCNRPSCVHVRAPAWLWHRQPGLSRQGSGQAQVWDTSQQAGEKSPHVLWKREFRRVDTNRVTTVVLRDREHPMNFYLLFILFSKSSHHSRSLSSHTEPCQACAQMGTWQWLGLSTITASDNNCPVPGLPLTRLLLLVPTEPAL